MAGENCWLDKDRKCDEGCIAYCTLLPGNAPKCMALRTIEELLSMRLTHI
jgi:hypothetical protein